MKHSTCSQIDALVALEEIWVYLDNHSDVNDGEDGQPQANRAMQLMQQVEQLEQFVKAAKVPMAPNARWLLTAAKEAREYLARVVCEQRPAKGLYEDLAVTRMLTAAIAAVERDIESAEKGAAA